MLRTRSQLGRALDDARHLTDCLFPLIRPDSLYDRPIAERHRIIFYLGHVEAFDWNLLGERAFGLKSFNKTFDRLFAFGTDPGAGGLPADQPSAWPSREEVDSYNAKLRAQLDAALQVALSQT